ncbi:MAG: hypothetical protein AAF928_18805 [Myxococcota bacterium]
MNLSPDARAVVDAARRHDDDAPLDDVTRARLKKGLLATISSGAVTTGATAAATTTAGAGSTAAGAGTATAATGVGSLGVGSLGVGFFAKMGAVLGVTTAVAATGAYVSVALETRAPTARTISTAPPKTFGPEGAAPRGADETALERAVDADDGGREAMGPAAASPSRPNASVAPATRHRLAAPTRAPRTVDGTAASSSGQASSGQGGLDGAPRPPTADAEAASPSDQSALAKETALLREAQQRLRAGDPDGALVILDEHQRAHAGGILEEEREAARAVALCRAGRRAEGRAMAAALAQRAPQSPHQGRIRNACR